MPYTGDDDATSPPKSGIEPPKRSEEVKATPFIESPEMIHVIGPSESESVQDCLRPRLVTLTNVLVKPNGYIDILKPLPECETNSPTSDREEGLTQTQVFRIQLKSAYMKALYEVILSKAGRFKFPDAWDEARKNCESMGWEPKSSVTLARWHVLFRSNGGLFDNPLSNRFDKN